MSAIQQVLFSQLLSSFPGTTFYVNTDAAGGGDGSAGAPWNHLRTGITANALDTALAAGPARILCSGVTADDQNVTQSHWNSVTTTPANYLSIIGDNTTGILNTNAYRITTTNGNLIYNNFPGHVRLYFLQGILNVTDSGNTWNGFRLSTQNVGPGLTNCDCRIVGCIATRTGAGTSGAFGFYNSPYAETNGGLIRLYNNLAFGLDKGFGAAWDQVTNYNNTAVNNTVDDFEDAQVCINCLAGSGLGFNSVGTGGGLSNYNASADGSATAGAQSRVNQTFTFVNAGANNYQLANNDAGARGFGQNDPASGLFLDDIRGVVRQTSPTAWDIGAWRAAT